MMIVYDAHIVQGVAQQASKENDWKTIKDFVIGVIGSRERTILTEFPNLILSEKQSRKIDCDGFRLLVACLLILDDHDFSIPLMNFK